MSGQDITEKKQSFRYKGLALAIFIMTYQFNPLTSSSLNNNDFKLSSLRLIVHLAKKLGYTFLDCKTYYEKRKRNILPEKMFVFRIDVDRSPNKALIIASIFKEEKIPATFFYRLHSESYQLTASKNNVLMKSVHDMGFEIGLHCEPLVTSFLTGKPPETVMKEDIGLIEDLLHDKIVGVASHGDSRYKQINNLDFWKYYMPEDFGLYYEAYDPVSFGLFQCGRYISDSELVHWKVYDKGILRKGDHRPLEKYLADSILPLYVLIHPFLFKD